MSAPDRRSARGRAEVDALVAAIRAPTTADPEDVQAHLDSLTKPPGSLGRLEELAAKLARIVGDPPPALRPRTIVVLAGDHGVVDRNVSAYPAEVTVQMCRNIADGGAAVSVLARLAGADVVVGDLGVASPVEHPGVLDRNVVRGAADLSVSPALSADEVTEAILAGSAIVAEAAPTARIVAIGEMGIGNSTAAAALTACLLDLPAEAVVGPGTGLDPSGVEHKRRIVDQALARLAPGDHADPLRALSEVGGAEIAGLVGVVQSCAARGTPVLVDGFIATSAALVAARMSPRVVEYLFASHLSPEPGHRRQLDALGLEPILDLGLRLGEGSGAALALPILDAAAAILREMATFAGAGVSGRSDVDA